MIKTLRSVLRFRSVELDPVDGAQFVKQLIGAKFPGIWTTLHSS